MGGWQADIVSNLNIKITERIKNYFYGEIAFMSRPAQNRQMKIIAMIPARYAATRFPGKLMQMLGNKTVIRHTYENTLATGLFDEVVVVTDSDDISKEISAHGDESRDEQEGA